MPVNPQLVKDLVQINSTRQEVHSKGHVVTMNRARKVVLDLWEQVTDLERRVAKMEEVVFGSPLWMVSRNVAVVETLIDCN